MLSVRHSFDMLSLILDNAVILARNVLSTNKRSLKIPFSIMVRVSYLIELFSFKYYFLTKRRVSLLLSGNSPWDQET